MQRNINNDSIALNLTRDLLNSHDRIENNGDIKILFFPPSFQNSTKIFICFCLG